MSHTAGSSLDFVDYDLAAALTEAAVRIVRGCQGIANPGQVASAFVERTVKDQHANWGDRD